MATSPTRQQLSSFNMLYSTPRSPAAPSNHIKPEPHPHTVVLDSSFEQFEKAEREWKMKQDAWMLR